MANRLGRAVRGGMFEFSGQGRISDRPSVPAGDGGMGAMIHAAFGGLSKQLGKLADDAAKREGEAEGYAAGEAANPSRPQPVASVGPADRQAEAAGANDLAGHIRATAQKVGIDPEDLATAISYETGGTFDPWKKGPTTKWGTHRGLIQWGEPQAKQYGVSQASSVGEQLDAVGRYLQDRGVKPGMGLLDVYSAINAGGVGKYDASDAAAGGAPGTVRDKVERQMGGHREKARALLGGGAAFADMPAAAGPVPAEPPPPPAPLALRRDGTVKGAAFDAAAMQVYAGKLDAGIRADIDGAYRAHESDPAALQKRLGEIRTAYEADATLKDPELRVGFNRRFDEQSAAYLAKANTNAEQTLHAEAKESASLSLSAMRQDLERQSLLLGANPSGDAALGDQLGRLERAADAASARGFLTPRERETMKREARETIAVGKIRGTFDALPDAVAKKRFAEGLEAEWAKGEGALGQIDHKTMSSLASRLSADAKRLTDDERGQVAVDRERMERLVKSDISSIETTGAPVALNGRELSSDEVSAHLGAAKADEWLNRRNLARVQHAELAGLPAMTEADIDARVKALAPTPGQANFADAKSVQDAVAKRAAQIKARRLEDPAGAVDEAFPKLMGPLAERFDPARPETLRDLADARLTAQAAIGIAPDDRQAVTAREARAIGIAMYRSPPDAVAWASAINEYGLDAGKVLGKLAEDQPGLALAADFARKGADHTALGRLAAQAMTERQPGWKAPPRSEAHERTLAAAAFGPALTALPRQERAIRDNAWKIFQSLARERGIAPDPKEPAGQALFEDALLAASGGKRVNGRQFGGVAEINGQKTFVPPGMEIGQFERALQSLTDDDLKALPPIRSGNNVPVRAKDLRDWRPVAAGDGIYFMAQDDPQSESPRYAVGEDGMPWRLDMRALAGRTPSADPVYSDPMGAFTP